MSEKTSTNINSCLFCKFSTDNAEKHHVEICSQMGETKEGDFVCKDLRVCPKTDHLHLAKYIMQQHIFKTMDDSEEIYFYQDGVYKPNGEILIKGEVEKLFDEEITTNYVNEVRGHIERRTYVSRKRFDNNPRLITVENGILDIELGILKDFTPNHLSLIKIPVTYDPLAECPTIEKFLSEIVDVENIEVLKEIVGYLLEPSYFIHKAFMLIGGGFNAKSTYIDLLINFVGRENTSQEPLQDIIYKTFSTAELYGKLLNSFADLTNVALTRTGKFKALCGGDRSKGRTLYHRPFYFYNKAKLVFSTNKMPKSEDVTDAFFGRWIIIPFPYIFDETNPKTNKKILETITTQKELSGLLNIALQKLKQLRENQKFSSDKTVEDIREYYMKLSNPVYAFIDERCVIASNAWVTKTDLYNDFVQYCKEKKLTKMSQTTFTIELKKQVRLAEERKTIKKGVRKTIWVGIALERQMAMENGDETLDSY